MVSSICNNRLNNNLKNVKPKHYQLFTFNYKKLVLINVSEQNVLLVIILITIIVIKIFIFINIPTKNSKNILRIFLLRMLSIVLLLLLLFKSFIINTITKFSLSKQSKIKSDEIIDLNQIKLNKSYYETVTDLAQQHFVFVEY